MSGIALQSIQIGGGRGVGTTVSTGELESPERAQDHFNNAPTSPSRVAGTVYQNTGTTARLVVVTFALTTARAQLLVGAADPPVTVACDTGGGGINVTAMTFVWLVRPGNYYELLKTSGTTLTVLSWQEVNL